MSPSTVAPCAHVQPAPRRPQVLSAHCTNEAWALAACSRPGAPPPCSEKGSPRARILVSKHGQKNKLKMADEALSGTAEQGAHSLYSYACVLKHRALTPNLRCCLHACFAATDATNGSWRRDWRRHASRGRSAACPEIRVSCIR